MEWMDIDILKTLLRRMAAMDIVLSEKANLRCFFYKIEWRNGVDIAWYENGGGDDIYILFKGEEAIIKGFDHESEVSPHAQETFHIWPGIYDKAPPHLLELLKEEDLVFEDVTFCYWKTSHDAIWQEGETNIPTDIDNGSSWLLECIHKEVEQHYDWIKHYYAIEPDINIIKALFNSDQWKLKDIEALNPIFNFKTGLIELKQLGIVVS